MGGNVASRTISDSMFSGDFGIGFFFINKNPNNPKIKARVFLLCGAQIKVHPSAAGANVQITEHPIFNAFCESKTQKMGSSAPPRPVRECPTTGHPLFYLGFVKCIYPFKHQKNQKKITIYVSLQSHISHVYSPKSTPLPYLSPHSLVTLLSALIPPRLTLLAQNS